MGYLQIFLSSLIIIIGLVWTVSPAYVVRTMRREKVEGGEISEEDKDMGKRVRSHGILNLVIGSTWLAMELTGFMSEFYGIALSVGVLSIGMMWLMRPIHAPQKNQGENDNMRRRAKRSGKIFFTIGAVFLIIEILAILSN